MEKIILNLFELYGWNAPKREKLLEAARPTCMVEITQHTLKGQKLLAQGIALGYFVALAYRPVRAKALKLPAIYKASALSGRIG